jgi:hypothetical protein
LTKFLVVCCALAVLSFLGAQIYLWRLGQHLEDTIKACEAESARSIAAAKAAIATSKEKEGPWTKWQLDPMVCDAMALSKLSDALGVQKQVVEAYRDVSARKELPYLISIPILILGILPHFWYFLLRRLREIASAIRGT